MKRMSLKGLFSRLAQSAALNVAQLRGTTASRAMSQAKAAATRAIATYLDDRAALIAGAKSGSEIVGTWSDIEALQKRLSGNSFRSAKRVLTTVLLNDLAAKMDHKLQTNTDVLACLQNRGARETARLANDFDRMKKTLFDELFTVGATLTTQLQDAFADSHEHRILWRQAFRKHLFSVRDGLDLAPPDCARDVAEGGIKADILFAYERRLRETEARFESEDAPGLRAGIQRHRYEAPFVVPLFRDGKRFLRSEVSPSYLESKTHKIDKMINGVVTVSDPDGSVWLQSRLFEDGGAYPFERHWMTVHPELLKQSRDAEQAAQSPAYAIAQDTKPQKRMYFVDQIPLTQAIRNSLPTVGRLELSGTSDDIRHSIASFVTRMRGLQRSDMELSIFAFEGMDDYVGLDNVISWLTSSPERQISLYLDTQGLVYLVLTLRRTVRGLKQVSRTEINAARLTALLAVAIMDRAANGSGIQRSYPRKMRSVGGRVEIPDQCVWPLQVKPKGKGATSRISSAASLADVLAGPPAKGQSEEAIAV